MIWGYFGPRAPPQSLQYQSSRRQLNVRILCFLITGVLGRPHMRAHMVHSETRAESDFCKRVSTCRHCPPHVL